VCDNEIMIIIIIVMCINENENNIIINDINVIILMIIY